jgi:hypothetical protein
MYWLEQRGIGSGPLGANLKPYITSEDRIDRQGGPLPGIGQLGCSPRCAEAQKPLRNATLI